MMLPVRTLLSLLLLLALPASHQLAYGSPEAPSRELVESNLHRLDSVIIDEAMFFTMTMRLDKELLVVESDPTRDKSERRKLVSVDGAPPTKERLDKFVEDERKRLAEEEQNPERNLYAHLVDTSTLELDGVENGIARFRFAPRLANFEDQQDRMQGTLSLDTGSGLLTQIRIENTEELSPAFSVSIQRYQLELNFGLSDDYLLIQAMTTQIDGKLGFVRSFQSEVQVEFSDFRSLTTRASTISLPDSG